MSTCVDRLSFFAEKAGRLVSLPAVALEVLRLTAEPKVDIPALKRCIENDPALTIRILRVVNSSLFGVSTEVRDLNQALALLGLKPLKLLVLGFSLADPNFCKLAGDAMDRYWRRTLTKAVAARELSQSLWRKPGDEPFIAALLQDLGLLVLLQQLGQPYSALLAKVLADGGDLAAAERRSLGFDHTELTAHLMTAWGLPATLSNAIKARTAREVLGLPAAERPLSQIVHLAGLLADLVVDDRQEVLPELMQVGVDHHLTSTALTDLVSELQGKVEQLANVFALQLPVGLDYAQVLTRAQGQLSDAAADAAYELIRRSRNSSDSIESALLTEVQALNSAAEQFLTGDAQTAVETPPPAMPESAAPGRWSASVVHDVGQNTALVARLGTAVAACRQARCALSLALVEVDHFHEWQVGKGSVSADKVVALLRGVFQHLDVPGLMIVETGPARWGLVLPEFDRDQAIDLGLDLVRSASQLLPADRGPRSHALTVSVGVATVPLPYKGFQPTELLAAATRCLSAAETSGNCSKSIGIY